MTEPVVPADPAEISGTQNPDIDVVIAVHTTTRPLSRAIASCLNGSQGLRIRITVVCHNISAEEINRSADTQHDNILRYLELHDGKNSPAGPKNAGLNSTTAPFVCVLDSDDFLEPGALANWYQLLNEKNADAVIAPVRHESGPIIKTPRVRLGRTENLDPVKDRLPYATAVRGLWRTNLGRFGEFRYVEGLRTAEDLAPGLQLYFSGGRFLFPAKGPAYVLGNESDDRVTSDLLPLAEEFLAIFRLPDEWLKELSPAARKGIAVKLARTSLVSALKRRGSGADWGIDERSAVQQLVEFLTELAPEFRKPLSAAEDNLILGSLVAAREPDTFLSAIQAFENANVILRTLGKHPLGNLDPDSAFRQIIRAALDRRQ
ncbi:glycosyltransferase family A protein [Arthrobacter psychrochitiniphilus]|uniref:Glycosyltransferase 2-like domain-containing protein n=1 Tax=Arthrobacter psychrochitiniphilus TaxID=291045 RepID=A0A2V3DPN0_9MICC|nr:glycosyltransferase [Arthrobacter psychrochitiniphilus]NYG18326.1 glycosyltransferase involved in cell wall biosynthesis [Arthrobacter psychrochitiniphilus]PXA64895.1 hypothetical protein CVS29_11870 [Arthrobacter psychrochitiniphilus]